MKLIPKILAAFACLLVSVSFAQRGKDGSPTISTVKIVNEYTTLASDVIGFPSSITVAAATNTLNANGRFTGPLAPGDLIMIIQMQGISVNGDTIQGSGGTIYGTPVDNTWGQITNYNNCGNYEFAEVKSVPADGITINLDCALQHDYSIAGRVQVIRVPRYSSLIVAAGGSITCPAWVTTTATKGTGGIVAIEVQGNTQINTANGITSSALGFRGGSIVGDNSSGTGGGQVARSDKLEGAEKGEGIFGYQADYDKIGGRYCRGAAGNAGGGGNMHNAAGGGGANAGNINSWDGEGNPDASVAAWITAWNREAMPSFATHTSSGGGRGGYSFASVNRDATLEGPRPFGSGATNNWGGDFRTNNGGWGGRPLDYSTGRLFMGGGGGAGDQDNNQAGDGGKGGGMIYFMSYGTVSGTGSITANGAAGINSGIDGAGGGGGGGTVIINSVGAISGISISANGGVGGNQVIPAFTTVQSEGPGGGGGGGYIGISNGTITQTVNGGANGTTDSPHLTEFIPNGATKGGSGLSNQSITNFTIAASNVSICSGNTATLTATLSGTVPSVTITWWDAQVGGSVVGTGSSFTTPVLTSNTTYYVGTCPGTYRIPVVVTITAGPTASNAGGPQTVCGTTAALLGNTPASGTGTWTLVSGAGTITTPASPSSGITALGAGPNVFEWTISMAGCSSSSSQVTITGVTPPTTSAAGSPQTVCGTTTALAGNPPTSGTGLWTLISGSGTITTPSSATSGVTGLAAGANVFQWTISNSPCPASSSQVTINVSIPPTTSAAGGPQTVCGTTAALLGNTPASGSGTWTLISGAGTITTPSSPSSGITALAAGPNVFEWSITNGSCPASTSQVTITGVTPPTISAAGSPQTVCGTTITLAGNPPTSGTGFWTLISGSGSILSPTSPTSGVTGLGAGANVFEWTISNGACPSSSSQVTITTGATADATITQPSSVCVGALPFNLSAATSGGSWSGTGITSSTNGTFDPSIAGVGTDTITYSFTGSCSSMDTVVVTVTSTSNTTITQPANICVGAPAFNLSAATPGGTWAGLGITNSTTGTFDPSLAGIGLDTISYTISGSCGSMDTVVVNVTSTSDATITQPSSVCSGAAPFDLTAATPGGIWSGPGIINSTIGTFDPSIVGVGTDTIRYNITGSCGGTDTVIITVNATTNATITQPANVCATTPPFNLSAATAGGTWTGIGITNAVNGTFDPSVAGVGSDTIRYTISGNCGAFDTVVIKVNPPSNATINNVLPVCQSALPFNLSAATTGGIWSGTGITNSANGTFDPAIGPGTYTITYTISGACGNSDIQSVTVNATPNPAINASSTTGCAPLCVQFTETASTLCNTLNYQFGDGNSSSTSSPLHCYNQAGVYPVSITCNDNNSCSGTTTINNMITVLPTPVANFSVSPSGIVGTNAPVTVTDVSTSGGNQAWDFGDPISSNNTSSLSSDSHSYATEGDFCIQLISTNIGGCADTTSNCIVVANDATLSIPNVFTPNGDGNNDVFNISSTGLKTLSINIYDRWGLKITELNSINGGWDGRTSSGKVSADGVYYYILKATSVNDKNIEKEGFVQLLSN